jgi:bile acid:Na+ symporter, BASS family
MTMELEQLATWALQLSILLIVFGLGLKTSTDDLHDMVRRPSLLARLLLAMFVLMPLVAVLLARALDVPQVVEAALIALAISPLPLLIPSTLTRLGGRASQATALLAAIAVLSIVVAPVLAELLERFLGRPHTVSSGKVAAVIAVTVLLPLYAGMLIRAVRIDVAERIELPISIAGNVVLRLAALVLLVMSWSAVWSLLGNGTIIAIAIFVVAGLAAGHVLGGPAAGERTVLALATAFRHPGIALGVAAANFPSENFVAVILLYLLVSAIVGVPYAIWRRRVSGDLSDAGAAGVILDARKKAVEDIQAGRAAPYYIIPPADADSPGAGSSPRSSGSGNQVNKGS